MTGSHYLSPTLEHWSGRKENQPNCYFHEVVRPLLLADFPPEEKGAALIGFAVEEGVLRNGGRTGAKVGPDALRKVLGKMALPHQGVPPLYDVGTVTCDNQDLEGSQQKLAEIVAKLHAGGFSSFVIGGGHEVAFAHYQGLFKAYPKKKIGILQLDAHFDMRPLKDQKGTSGTSFAQIADYAGAHGGSFDHLVVGIQPYGNNRLLFERAAKQKSRWIFADDLKIAPAMIQKLVEDNDIVYVSLCLDVVASAFAPGVSAPQSLGLLPKEIYSLLENIFENPKTVAFDIAELSPPNDVGSITAHLAASFAALWFNKKMVKAILGKDL